MSTMRELRQSEDGAAAIEGAIVLLTFIFLIFSVMELLYVLFAYNTVVRAAENTARYAMYHSAIGCPALEGSISDATGQVSVIPVQISVVDCKAGIPATCSSAGPTAGPGTILIHAEYDFKSAGFFLAFLSSTLPIQANVCVPLINLEYPGNPA